jgi:hypothetical protein
MYDEIFQAMAVEEDALLPKPFLDLGFNGVVRWKSPASGMFFSFPHTSKSTGNKSGLYGGWGEIRKWLQ